jgi:hypothetical protein
MDNNGFPMVFIFLMACAMFVAWPDPEEEIEMNEIIPKKAIFLDIDGVLNSDKMLREGMFKTGDRADMISPEMVARLERIIEAHPEVLIILSSSWRISQADLALECMKKQGFSRDAFDGKTNTKGRDRGRQIQDWLDEHPEVTKFIILDDELHGMLHLEEHVIKSSWYIGLLDEHADEAIKRLNN